MIIQELSKSQCSQCLIKDFIKSYEYLLPDPFSLHVDLDEYAKKLNDLGVTYVLNQDNKIVGLVSGYINDFTTKEAYMQILIVAKDAQGCGNGSKLIKAFVNHAKMKFATGKVFLTVDKENVKAASVYLHLGFMKSDRVHANCKKQILVYDF